MRLMPLTIVLSWPVRWLHRQQIGPLRAGWFVADFLLVVDFDWIGRIEASDAMVFDIHARRTIARGGNDVTVVEANLERPRFDFAVPIRSASAEAEMPFADDACGVAGVLATSKAT